LRDNIQQDIVKLHKLVRKLRETKRRLEKDTSPIDNMILKLGEKIVILRKQLIGCLQLDSSCRNFYKFRGGFNNLKGEKI